ncbi:MAG: flagellar motor protein MotA [Gammaproteobacteria bacterium]|nr:flagellar motor protein MotA [Gammaproteobacteria bacterium]MBT8124693.1 flagellar motor protein MotA [Gammaproteobacteria bacterium]MDH3609048.1 flagellar motor protein MotA [Gammaproteobacteria bacterium]NNC68409.1 flagellar motor protein MotA [Gammaproteobacteria bacterium]
MTRPYNTLMWMVAFVFAAAIAITFVYDPVIFAFKTNPWFNTLIALVLVVGIVHNFQQVLKLYKEISWIENFRNTAEVKRSQVITPLLAPMARMLSKKGRDRLTLSTMSMRSILDSIANRLDESRDISRYLIGLLIFLGLLGTFWGLLATISSVSDVIKGMSGDGEDSLLIFENLKIGLQQPLSGMGIAFSSSLFGLAGSLILGFLDLQAGHAQRRFFNELEEWLSGITYLSSGALPGDGETPVPVYVQALLEQTADGINSLQRELSKQNSDRTRLDSHLLNLTQQLAEVAEYLQRDQQPFSEELRKELRILTRTIGASLANQQQSK